MIETLSPFYEFGVPNQDVVLSRNEPVTIVSGKHKIEGVGNAILTLGRKANSVFQMEMGNDFSTAQWELGFPKKKLFFILKVGILSLKMVIFLP